jgi:hypothetical protein
MSAALIQPTNPEMVVRWLMLRPAKRMGALLGFREETQSHPNL